MKKTEKNYPYKEIEVIKGSPEDKDNYVYYYKENGLCVREVEYKTGKGGDDVEICQITDTHISELNERDKEENNPSVMSTYEKKIVVKWGVGGWFNIM